MREEGRRRRTERGGGVVEGGINWDCFFLNSRKFLR